MIKTVMTLVLTAVLTAISSPARAGQKEFQKLTVGFTPIAGAALPLFIAVEEKIFQKYGYEIFPVFMGGSPLINSAILAGEFPIGYTGGGAVIASHLSGSDLIAIASPLPVLTIDGWSKPEIKSIADVRGKRVGVTRFGASSYFSALSMLEAGGIKPSEVTFIQNGGVGESFAALQGERRRDAGAQVEARRARARVMRQHGADPLVEDLDLELPHFRRSATCSIRRRASSSLAPCPSGCSPCAS